MGRQNERKCLGLHEGRAHESESRKLDGKGKPGVRLGSFSTPATLQLRVHVFAADEFEIAAGGVEQEMSDRSFVVLYKLHRETAGEIEAGFR